MATTITSTGTPASPRVITCRDTRRCYYWVDGTSVKGKHLDLQGNTLVAEFTATLSGGALTIDASSRIDVWEFVDQKGRHWFRLQCIVSGDLIEYTSRDGVDFS